MIVERPTLSKWDARYQAWIADAPHLFAAIERCALAYALQGRRFGVKRIVEDLRWDAKRTWELDDAGFKFNGAFVAYVARDLIAKHPHLGEFIETRVIRAA